MSELLTLIEKGYTRFDLESIDDFIERLDNIPTPNEFFHTCGIYNSAQQDLEVPAIIDDQLGTVKIDWLGDGNGCDTISINFHNEYGMCKIKYPLAKVIDVVRLIEFSVKLGKLPTNLVLRNDSGKLAFRNLNGDSPELYISNPKEARVTSCRNLAAFLVGLSLEVRRVLLASRTDSY